MEDNILINYKIDYKKLLDIGFKKYKDYYQYKEKIMNNKFLLIIKIDLNNIITSDVIDISSNEKFILYYVKSTTGEFVSNIRREYELIIDKIKNISKKDNSFKSDITKSVIKYIKDKYDADLEYLWEKYDNNAVWRNKDNNKWFGVLLTINGSKLGLDDKEIEIIDLLMDSDDINKIVDNKLFFRGYHMNKKHWITFVLDGSVPINKIYNLIDNSYNICKMKK